MSERADYAVRGALVRCVGAFALVAGMGLAIMRASQAVANYGAAQAVDIRAATAPPGLFNVSELHAIAAADRQAGNDQLLLAGRAAAGGFLLATLGARLSEPDYAAMRK